MLSNPIVHPPPFLLVLCHLSVAEKRQGPRRQAGYLESFNSNETARSATCGIISFIQIHVFLSHGKSHCSAPKCSLSANVHPVFTQHLNVVNTQVAHRVTGNMLAPTEEGIPENGSVLLQGTVIHDGEHLVIRRWKSSRAEQPDRELQQSRAAECTRLSPRPPASRLSQALQPAKKGQCALITASDLPSRIFKMSATRNVTF